MNNLSNHDDQSKINVFLEMKKAWEAKDWASCAALMAEDGVLQSMMLEPCRGRDNFHERIRKTEKPNKRVILHIRSIGVINGTLYVERNDEIILNGQSRFIPTVGAMEFKDGKIAYWREYYDRATLLEAIQEDPQH